MKFTEEIKYEACGKVPDTTRTKIESMYSVLPLSLSGRAKYSHDDAVSLNTVVDIDEGASTVGYTPRQEQLSWVVKFENINVKESVGKGAIGDFHRATWDGKEGVIKVLLNQKLLEHDLLHLKTTIGVLSKMKHPNLLQVYGVCLEPKHIGLLQEYMPKGNLHDVLMNDAISLNWATKIRIAKQVAEGMLFLAKYSDPVINVNANLKTGNVLVNLEKGETKITDYGQGNLKDLARTMTSVGSVAWTAPEVLNGDEATPAISTYAYGIMLYEIAARKIPYPNEHPIKLVGKIVCGHRPTPPTDLPPGYQQLMEQCWNADPSMRPSWTSIIHSLSQIM